jgi:hypothetical protein
MHRTFGLWARYTIGLTPYFHPEGEGGGGGGDAAAEALKKANFERDSANARALTLQKEIDALKAKVPSDEDLARLKKLETDAATAEEERKKKAGEFETLKTELVNKHQAELRKAADDAVALQALITNGEIDRAFANAYVDKTPLFGDDKALTVFTSDIAADAFRKYVTVEMVDGKPVVKVKDGTGKVVIDSKTGNAAAFGPALLEVINALPTKDRILRGSGKTGSGSSGGSGSGTSTGEVDFSNLTQAQMRDPKIIEASKRRTAAAGGIVSGEAWERTVKTT